jgi:hypothetical protein
MRKKNPNLLFKLKMKNTTKHCCLCIYCMDNYCLLSTDNSQSQKWVCWFLIDCRTTWVWSKALSTTSFLKITATARELKAKTNCLEYILASHTFDPRWWSLAVSYVKHMCLALLSYCEAEHAILQNQQSRYGQIIWYI